MNHKLLKKIADGEGTSPEGAVCDFRLWLFELLPSGDRVNLLGKNVGSFDLQFLKRLPRWPTHRIHYRCLDVGSMWATSDGMESQSELEATFSKDFGITGSLHEALYDARVSLALAKFKWEHECG
jgi:hypothetical protein